MSLLLVGSSSGEIVSSRRLLGAEAQLCSRAALVANSSQRLLSSWLAWPLVQVHLISWPAAVCSSSIHKSWFTTGFFAAVFQPLRFQPWIQVVMPFFRYSESVTTSTLQCSLRERRPSIAAVSSMRLLVVCGTDPDISRVCSPKRRTYAHPP